jgi:hypothetical protein
MSHILNHAGDHQQAMNSFHHPHHPLNHLQQSVMNGGMPVPQVIFLGSNFDCFVFFLKKKFCQKFSVN